MIDNVRIYDIFNSIIDSGLPKNEHPVYSFERAQRLSNAPIGSGHNSFLKGIIVRYDLTADHSFFIQFLRYHFHDIVSSSSKMHCITSMAKKYNYLVLDDIKKTIQNLIDIFNSNPNFPLNIMNDVQINNKEELFECIIMNIPLGFELKSSIVSNYLQLKTIYNQRKYHKMSSWKNYCKWIETLPYAKELICI